MASSAPSISTISVAVLPPKPNLGFVRRPSCLCSPIGPTRAFPNPRTGPSGPNRPRWPWFCRAASPGPPPPPAGPPSSEDPIQDSRFKRGVGRVTFKPMHIKALEFNQGRLKRPKAS